MNGASWSTTTAENNRAGHSAWDESRVNPDSINGTPVNYTRLIADMQQHAITNPNLYQNMNASDCFRYYDDYWKPQGDALVFVTNSSLQTDPNDSLLLYVTVVPRSDDWAKNMWALSNGTNQFVASSGDVQISSSNTPWVLGPPRLGVARCLVRDAPARASRCRFEYSPPIMWTVCCLNFVKATVMLSIWLLRARQRDVRTPDERDVLYTLGDAISSFMRRPDEDTKDKGLSGMKDFRQSRSIKRGFTKRPRDGIQPHPRQLEMESIRWMRAASIRKWCVFLCA